MVKSFYDGRYLYFSGTSTGHSENLYSNRSVDPFAGWILDEFGSKRWQFDAGDPLIHFARCHAVEVLALHEHFIHLFIGVLLKPIPSLLIDNNTNTVCSGTEKLDEAFPIRERKGLSPQEKVEDGPPSSLCGVHLVPEEVGRNCVCAA